MHPRTFFDLWFELQQAHDAHTLHTYDRFIGEEDRKHLERLPVVPTTSDELAQVIGYTDLAALLARATTAD